MAKRGRKPKNGSNSSNSKGGGETAVNRRQTRSQREVAAPEERSSDPLERTELNESNEEVLSSGGEEEDSSSSNGTTAVASDVDGKSQEPSEGGSPQGTDTHAEEDGLQDDADAGDDSKRASKDPQESLAESQVEMNQDQETKTQTNSPEKDDDKAQDSPAVDETHSNSADSRNETKNGTRDGVDPQDEASSSKASERDSDESINNGSNGDSDIKMDDSATVDEPVGEQDSDPSGTNDGGKSDNASDDETMVESREQTQASASMENTSASPSASAQEAKEDPDDMEIAPKKESSDKDDGGETMETEESSKAEEETSPVEEDAPDSIAATAGDTNGSTRAHPIPDGGDKEQALETNSSETQQVLEEADDDAEDGDDDEEEEEAWDLVKILGIEDLHDGIVCEGGMKKPNCKLQAAVLYVEAKKQTKWYGCLDCQESEFGGWPEKLSEIPISSMTDEHVAALARKCSKKKSPEMPDFLPSSSTEAKTPVASKKIANFVSPIPQGGVLSQKSNGNNASQGATITPLEKTKTKPGDQKKQKKALMESQKKWQAAAEKLGGKGARLVLDKESAKTLIYEMLHDRFRPMNITEINEALKAVVPGPILKSCLEALCPATTKKEGKDMFYDSDDENEDMDTARARVSEDKLIYKDGRNSNTSLWYANYHIDANSGNGLDPEGKNRHLQELKESKDRMAGLQFDIKTTVATSSRLLGEPKNDELDQLLEKEEDAVSALKQEAEGARKFIGNEKKTIRLKRRVETMATQLNKRRKICLDFLYNMEEISDGSISTTKCLKGDGPIDIDDDQAALSAEAAFAKKKKTSSNVSRGKKKKNATDDDGGLPPPSADFIGIRVDNQCRVTRVHLDDFEP